MSEKIIFLDADYINFLAAADAFFDPTGTSTPALDALLDTNATLVITSTVRQEATGDTSFPKDFVLDLWIDRNIGNGLVVPQTPESPGGNGGEYDGTFIGGGEASIQNFIESNTSADDDVFVFTNNLRDYRIQNNLVNTSLSQPYSSLNEMFANGEINLQQYDFLAASFFSGGAVPTLGNAPAFLIPGAEIDFYENGVLLGTAIRLPEGIIFRDASGAQTVIGYTDRANLNLGDSFNPPVVECFAAGTNIRLANGALIAIEDVLPGQEVQSYDATGALVPSRVTQLFRNEVSHLLDVHGLKVTPGHVTLCGDGPFKGAHVPIIDILLSDGALVRENGDLVRMAIDKPVGSVEDRFVEVSYAEKSEDVEAKRFKTGRMRVGTLLFDKDGVPVSVLDCLIAQGYAFDPETGLVCKDDGSPAPMNWFGALPRPEDYILRRSRETLEGILVDGEWEGQPSELIAQRIKWTAARLH